MSTTQAPAATTWPRHAVADLIAANPVVPEADTELTASIQAAGITDPLYVVTTDSGALRIVDGMRRLAAAAAADLADVPVTYRPVIAVKALTAHPGNVRDDLKLTKTFLASIRTEGVRIPLKITHAPGGVLRVIDGHRRLGGAVAEGLTHVPYEYEERDEASQHLDMVTTARHREALTDAEEAAALFQAAELGAGVKRLAAASGRTQKETRTVLRVGGSASVRQAAQASTYSYTLDELAELAELAEADPAAAERITKTITEHPDSDHSWQISRAMTAVEVRRHADKHRAELEAAGARIRTLTELSDKATPVYRLRGAADHDDCQGQAWVLEEGNRRYTRYCTNPPFYGHPTNDQTDKPSAAQRRAIIEGNKDWDTAERRRRQWLTQTLSRKTHPKATVDQFMQITARVLLAASSTLVSRLNAQTANELLAEIFGKGASRRTLAKHADTAPRRNATHAFAAVAAAYEADIARSAWRTDGSHAHAVTRRVATQWLTWLSALGYQPSAIEAAVIADKPYSPSKEAADKADTLG